MEYLNRSPHRLSVGTLRPTENTCATVPVGTRYSGRTGLIQPRTKKADVAEHPEELHHVGLLVNEPPATTGLLFI
jgi:hypothetical protein